MNKESFEEYVTWNMRVAMALAASFALLSVFLGLPSFIFVILFIAFIITLIGERVYIRNVKDIS